MGHSSEKIANTFFFFPPREKIALRIYTILVSIILKIEYRGLNFNTRERYINIYYEHET